MSGYFVNRVDNMQATWTLLQRWLTLTYIYVFL